MKLPLTFGNRLLLRFLLPGAIVATGLSPLLHLLAGRLNVPVDSLYLFPATTLISGWILSLFDMPIYMIMEGRALWPKWLKERCMKTQRKKLDRWISKARNYEKNGNEAEATEMEVKAYRYPIGNGKYNSNSGVPTVVLPTELGNVIYGYETYSMVKYGADGVFFWERIWMGLDADLRREIDERQAICDSAVYSSFSCFVNTILFLIFSIFLMLSSIFSLDLASNLTAWQRAVEFLVVSLFFLVLWGVFYRAAVSTNFQFGERLKAMFDSNLDKLAISDALLMVSKRTGAIYTTTSFDPDNVMAAWRYLRWHKFRPPQAKSNINIEHAKKQNNK